MNVNPTSTKAQVIAKSLRWVAFNLEGAEPNTFEYAIKGYVEAAVDFIEKDVTTVRQGNWEERSDDMLCPYCNEIWNYQDNDTERFNYCPGCGADIREDNP